MIIDKEVLNYDFSKATNLSGYYFLANCSGYTSIDIQCYWTGINGVDAYVKYAEKNNVIVSTWDTSRNEMIILTTTNDSDTMKIRNFDSSLIAVYIEKGNVTSGILKIRILTNTVV